MYALAMSSAKDGEKEDALCLHISGRIFDSFHRAKPASELERSESERHCGVPGNTSPFPER